MFVTSSIDSHINPIAERNRTAPGAPAFLGAYDTPFEGRWTASSFGVNSFLFFSSTVVNEMISAGIPGMLIAVVAKFIIFVLSCH
jgi:hypothetical protein